MTPIRSGPRGPNQRGAQALVEFALTFPLLLAVFAAVVDLGYLCAVHLSITTGMREAMLAGSRDGDRTVTEIKDLLLASQQIARLDASMITVDLPASSASFGGAPAVSIEVSYNHKFLFLRLIDERMNLNMKMKMTAPRYKESS